MQGKTVRAVALFAFSVLLLATPALAGTMPAELKAKVDAKLKQFQPLGTDPKVVAAVKEHNANPPAEAKTMTQDKWKAANVLDPFVRSLSKNALAEYLKTKRDDTVDELFVSGADGTKVALFNKTTNWSHKGKDKHDVPMKGQTWVGAVEMDQSSGLESVQIGLPVLDGGKPIGSLVIGFAVSKLK